MMMVLVSVSLLANVIVLETYLTIVTFVEDQVSQQANVIVLETHLTH
jgi:hypothetical protein